MNKAPLPTRRRAVVVGASMGGLLAARVLADSFAEVVLLDRDQLPEGPSPRQGTPQAVHGHGLLARGAEILEELFPGLVEALEARGAVTGDLQETVPIIAGGRRFAAGRAGRPAIAVSRLLLEAEVRRRVLALPQVRLRTGVAVDGLLVDDSGQRVTGVRLSGGGAGAVADETLAADLTVDASGRGSRSPAWLRTLGFEAPREDRVEVGIGYATAYFERRPEHAPGIAAIICSATPELPLPGVLIAQEPESGGPPRWVVTFGGYAGDHPEPTLDGLRERARKTRCPELERVTREATLLGPILRFGFPHSQRRRYERLARFPSGFLVFGDALASFNPIFGQGMTVAASGALALKGALGGSPERLARRYFRAAARAVDVAWQLAVGADLAIDRVPGPRPAAVRWVNRYLARLFVVAERDPRVARAFMEVAHLLAAPPSLFAPGVLLRVLRGA